MIVGRRSSPATGLVLAVAIPVLFAAGIGIRLWLWPAVGLKGDIDQFVTWVHGIAVNGWGNAYDQNLSFPAVMAWIWGALAAVEPAFRTVTDSSDPAIRALMKVPASLADLGIAAAVGWWFRDRPWAALAAVAAVLLWPVTWYVSAWWGQYESHLRAAGGARGAGGAGAAPEPRRGARRDQPDDEAAGAAVHRAVRGLVPRDAGAPRDDQGGGDRAS